MPRLALSATGFHDRSFGGLAVRVARDEGGKFGTAGPAIRARSKGRTDGGNGGQTSGRDSVADRVHADIQAGANRRAGVRLIGARMPGQNTCCFGTKEPGKVAAGHQNRPA
jgi:hypothetical protein